MAHKGRGAISRPEGRFESRPVEYDDREAARRAREAGFNHIGFVHDAVNLRVEMAPRVKNDLAELRENDT